MNRDARALRSTAPLLVIAFAHLLAGEAAGAGPSTRQETPRIVVEADNLLSTGVTDRPIVESQLAVRPGDPSHMIATAMIPTVPLPAEGEGLSEESRCATWLSRDGGTTWARRDHAIPGCGDPWVTITRDGVAVFIALGNDGMWAYRSPDGGETWDEPPIPFGVGHDHPTLAIDDGDAEFGGSVYIASARGGRNPDRQFRWTVYVARSSDGAQSFPFVTQVIPSNLSFEAQLPAVLSDGTLLVPFNDHHTIDGRRIEVGARRSWLLRSTDGGRTFSEPLFITDRCDGRGGWPSLIADPSGGLLYTCIAVDYGGVLVFRSDDRGETWSDAVRVDAGGSSAHSRVPTIAVSATGTIGVSWYERRDDPADECQYLHFAASTDGGASFHPDVRVSSERSCPDTSANDWTAARFPGGGDYAGLVATSGDRFRLVWSDARDGIFRLRTADVSVATDDHGTP